MQEILDGLEAQHDYAKALNTKMQANGQSLAAIREQLDSLTKIGDAVTEEDVVHSAGEIVRSGIPATTMAAMLADMPQSPGALPSWIGQQDAVAKQREALFAQHEAIIRHEMGASALRLIAGHSLMPPGADGQPQGQGNAVGAAIPGGAAPPDNSPGGAPTNGLNGSPV